MLKFHIIIIKFIIFTNKNFQSDTFFPKLKNTIVKIDIKSFSVYVQSTKHFVVSIITKYYSWNKKFFVNSTKYFSECNMNNKMFGWLNKIFLKSFFKFDPTFRNKFKLFEKNRIFGYMKQIFWMF